MTRSLQFRGLIHFGRQFDPRINLCEQPQKTVAEISAETVEHLEHPLLFMKRCVSVRRHKAERLTPHRIDKIHGGEGNRSDAQRLRCFEHLRCGEEECSRLASSRAFPSSASVTAFDLSPGLAWRRMICAAVNSTGKVSVMSVTVVSPSTCGGLLHGPAPRRDSWFQGKQAGELGGQKARFAAEMLMAVEAIRAWITLSPTASFARQTWRAERRARALSSQAGRRSRRTTRNPSPGHSAPLAP